jgi:uncharacterized membrane protein
MDAAHIHLILNHFPIAGMVFSIPLLLFAWWRRNEVLSRTAFIVILLTGLATIPTYLTGEPAEELIAHLPGVSERFIEIHEEAAERAIWAIGAATLVAAVGLFLSIRRKATPRWAYPVVLAAALASVGLLGWTNNLGGQVRHPEIRSKSSAPITDAQERGVSKEKDDD